MSREAINLERSPKESICLNAVVATGAGTALDVSEYDTILIMVASSATATATIQIQGTGMQTEPAWTTAQSATNVWDYREIIDLEDGTVLDGDTGIAFSGTAVADTVRQFELNCKSLTWVNARVTAWTAEGLTVWIRPYKTT